MSEKQIKHMVDRFLSWTLPTDFDPDAGISFDGSGRPSGTNLLTATQAEKMVWHMLEDLPVETDTMLERYLALVEKAPKYYVAWPDKAPFISVSELEALIERIDQI